MGVVQVVGFAACWVVVVALILWGVVTDRRRGRMGSELAEDAGLGGWFVVEVVEGAPAEVAEQAHFLATAWLATRGFDMATVPPGDIRTEVTTAGDGMSTTRVLVRPAAFHTSLHRH
jgi:hypothetical protein